MLYIYIYINRYLIYFYIMHLFLFFSIYIFIFNFVSKRDQTVNLCQIETNNIMQIQRKLVNLYLVLYYFSCNGQPEWRVSPRLRLAVTSGEAGRGVCSAGVVGLQICSCC